MIAFKKILVANLLLIVLLFAGCREDIDEFIPDPVLPAGQSVTTSIGGTIVNIDGFPLPGVIVHSGESYTTTDENGVFLLRNIKVNNEKALLSAELSGYFEGYRLLSLNENSVNYTKIVLLPKTQINTFSASEGGILQFAGDAVLNFPSGCVIDKNGNTFFGDVDVYAQWLDPSDESVYDKNAR